MSTLLDTFDDQNHVFAKKFHNMVNFFSQFMILGEVGTLLNQRMNYLGKDEDLFRYKNNYMTESLYDYNLYDILIAIENRWLCHLKYVMGVDYDEFEYLMIPLEIRISVRNGREHLIGYDVLNDQYISLRLDFIEKIVFYKKVKSTKLHFSIIDENIKKNIIKNHSSHFVDTYDCRKDQYQLIQKLNQEKQFQWNQPTSFIEYNKKTNDLRITFQKTFDVQNIKKQMSATKKISKALWGVNTSNDTIDNTLNKIDHLLIIFQYDPLTERYIIERIKKEKRIGRIVHIDEAKGEITFEINILLTNEIIPWLRSYYSRIKSISSMKIGNILDQENHKNNVFQMTKDVQDLYDLYFDDKGLENTVQISPRKKPNDLSHQTFTHCCIDVQGEKIDHCGHEDLFNELFSFYTVILADMLIHHDMNENMNKMKIHQMNSILNICIHEHFLNTNISQKVIEDLIEKVTQDIQEKITIHDFKNLEKTLNFIKNSIRTNMDICLRPLFDDFLELVHFIDENISSLMKIIEEKINKEIQFTDELPQKQSIDDLLDHEAHQLIKRLFQYSHSHNAQIYQNQIIDKIKNELYNDLFDDQQKFIYESFYTSYLKDVLPLTKVECRWLKTIVHHSFAQLFFDQDILHHLSKFIDDNNQDIKIFDLSKICYYDRVSPLPFIEDFNQESMITYFQLLMKNIDNKEHKFIKIEKYSRLPGCDKTDIKCAPLYLEFSKRDLKFRLCCSVDNEICLFNLDRMSGQIIELEETFDYSQEIRKVHKSSDHLLYIEFYNHRGVPDRILNEFSSWKKECIYDEKTYKYIMTLYYDQFEKRDNDLVIRLLSYGPYIKVYTQDDDPDNYIYKEYKKRIQLQRELIKEKELILERS